MHYVTTSIACILTAFALPTSAQEAARTFVVGDFSLASISQSIEIGVE